MDYEKLKDYRNENNVFGRSVNIAVTEIREGYGKAEMLITKECLNPVGSVHGGCLFTVADTAGSAAASSYGYHITTVDANFHYLNAGLNTTKLVATTREVKAGKKLKVYDISVADQDGKLLAEGMFTYMSLKQEIVL